ncbi:MAG: SDR family NAD(P)-dependent oxidoreductase [Alphaproteobacteria bacterium]|nr:SDR family NAD(P)-dependent oxidoreductase [Alphaproteobacteria bacterium]
MPPTSAEKVAVVLGVGAARGAGAAIARRIAREGEHAVVIGGRTKDRLEAHVQDGELRGEDWRAVVTDVTSPDSVRAALEFAEGLGPVDLVVYNAGPNRAIPFLELDVATVEEFWRVSCLGGFITLQEAIRRMLPRKTGTIICTGATGSWRGGARFGHFGAAKSGLRMFVQAAAREFGPQGLHIAHVVIDGSIDGERIRSVAPDRVQAKGEDGLLHVDGIADTYWHIYCQPRSAWTLEVDLRPFKEPF